MIGGMEIRLHRELADFVALAGPMYRADPVTHTVALTVLEQPASSVASAAPCSGSSRAASR
jgi:hypothetical protein